MESKTGKNLLDGGQENNIEVKGACKHSTCHVILKKDLYDNFPELEEDEEDTLDMAFELT